MPCSDWPRDDVLSARRAEENRIRDAKEYCAQIDHLQGVVDIELGSLKAMLCAICTVLESTTSVTSQTLISGVLPVVVNAIDEEEAGVRGSDILDWFARHKVEDERRRQREAEEKAARLILVRDTALRKLNAEERAALGL